MELGKGQKIILPHASADTPCYFCLGINWGAINLSSWFSQKQRKVDLDLSCLMLDAQGKLIDYVYSAKFDEKFLKEYPLGKGKFQSKDGAILHTGDDLTGDIAGDDGLDNETLVIDLPKIDPQITQVIFFINSTSEENFSEIPFVKVRMYEGDVNYGKKLFGEYDIVPSAIMGLLRTLVLGKITKDPITQQWAFETISEGTQDEHIAETIIHILKRS